MIICNIPRILHRYRSLRSARLSVLRKWNYHGVPLQKTIHKSINTSKGRCKRAALSPLRKHSPCWHSSCGCSPKSLDRRRRHKFFRGMYLSAPMVVQRWPTLGLRPLSTSSVSIPRTWQGVQLIWRPSYFPLMAILIWTCSPRNLMCTRMRY